MGKFVPAAVPIALVQGLAAMALSAEEAPAAEETAKRRLEVSVFVDGFYAYDFNEPAGDQENFFPGVGTSAKLHNEFAINLAEVDLVLPPKPVGFHLGLGIGNSLEVVHAAELSSVPDHPDAWRNVVRASIQYDTGVGRGLLLEGGIYPSHIGFEGLATKDNWNYTRSWLGELSPYYQTGVKASYPLSERWSTQLHLLNGWQVIHDNNQGKSLGLQFAYAGEKLSLSFNGIAGPEQADNDSDVRALFDTVAQYKATPALTFAASADVAREERPTEDARWYGIGLYARFAPPDRRSALAVRAEYYDDEDGAISGTVQTLREITLTFEHRPVESIIVKIEGRYDRSSTEVFAGSEVDVDGASIADQREQSLLLVGVVALF